MAFFVHREKQFDKLLLFLEQAGGNAAIAAGNVHGVIERLLSRQEIGAEVFKKSTKHGELRIRSCRKFDLGNGYRLICLRKGNHIILLYVGTHDECDRWLDNNRGLEVALDPAFSRGEQREIAEHEGEPTEDTAGGDYDDELMQKIDDRILREIFSGICKR